MLARELSISKKKKINSIEYPISSVFQLFKIAMQRGSVMAQRVKGPALSLLWLWLLLKFLLLTQEILHATGMAKKKKKKSCVAIVKCSSQFKTVNQIILSKTFHHCQRELHIIVQIPTSLIVGKRQRGYLSLYIKHFNFCNE